MVDQSQLRVMSEPLVKMESVSKSYKTHKVLDAVSMTVLRGEIVAITGRSGSGKSTILNLIGLIDKADDGSIHLFGEPSPKIRSSRARTYLRKKIGYLFQNAALIDQDSVEANLKLAQRYSEAPKSSHHQEREAALLSVGLAGKEKQKVYELSGGEQQRLALACLMVQPSELILADEPTGSLDHSNRDDVLRLLLHFRDQGKTIVVVTHDPIVAQIADRIVSLDK